MANFLNDRFTADLSFFIPGYLPIAPRTTPDSKQIGPAEVANGIGEKYFSNFLKTLQNSNRYIIFTTEQIP